MRLIFAALLTWLMSANYALARIDVETVPEPGVLGLIGIGAAAFYIAYRSRK